MNLANLTCVLALTLAACTSLESRPEPKADRGTPDKPSTPGKPSTPDKPTTPDRPVAPRVALRGAIASVSLIQNCSDDKPNDPPPPPSGKTEASQPAANEAAPGPAASQPISAGASAKPGGGGPGLVQPCTQSFMQLTLSHDGGEAQRITIAAVRLVAARNGKTLGDVAFRGPTRWDEAGHYVAWDQTIPATQELKASYKLGEPDWMAVGKAVGDDNTYVPRYILEVDIVLDGKTTTLRSKDFQREHAHVIVT